METYLTIKESKEAELTEQRSRFLSYISPAKDKEIGRASCRERV